MLQQTSSHSTSLPTQSIYLDKHTTYKSPKKQTIGEQLRNEMPMSQFEREMKELGIKVIHAHYPKGHKSAPAKGRVERGLRTYQDRFIKEMRLAGIKTKDEVNTLAGTSEFLKICLPKHNQKLGISPAKEVNGHRKSPGKKELKKILCIQTRRHLGHDAVIQHNSKFYQVENITRRRIKRVIVEYRLDGSMHVRNNGSYFKYREIDIKAYEKGKG